jgi:hypothetical protein
MSFGVTLTLSIEACHAQSLVSRRFVLAARARITGVYVSSNVSAKSAVTQRPKHTMHLGRQPLGARVRPTTKPISTRNPSSSKSIPRQSQAPTLGLPQSPWQRTQSRLGRGPRRTRRGRILRRWHRAPSQTPRQGIARPGARQSWGGPRIGSGTWRRGNTPERGGAFARAARRVVRR